MKTIVDNMARQCVEEILVRAIPDIFSPDKIIDMDSATVQRMAQESEANTARRAHLLEIQKLLESGLEMCRRHISSAGTGK